MYQAVWENVFLVGLLLLEKYDTSQGYNTKPCVMCQGQVRMSFKYSLPRSRARLTYDLPPQVSLQRAVLKKKKNLMAFGNEGVFLGRMKDGGPS